MSKERRKVRTGRVVSDKMDKTIVVAVQWSQRNRLYGKPMRRITKFYAHDATNDCSVGDLVQIEETRPISRQKNWRVVDVLERREVAEIRPMELDREFMESQMRRQEADTEAESAEAEATDVAVADDAPQTAIAAALAEAEAEAEAEATAVVEEPADEAPTAEESVTAEAGTATEEPTATIADEGPSAEPEEAGEAPAADEPEKADTSEEARQS